MYRRLASATGGLSRVLCHVSNELQQLADEAGESAPLSSTAASPPSSTSVLSASTTQQHSTPPRRLLHLPSRAEVQRVCAWVRDAGLSSWLPTSSSISASTGTHRWLTSMWCPPASESAHHSLTHSLGTSSSPLSDMEKSVANTAALLLGLPGQFFWPQGGKGDHAAAAQGKSMLWPTAMRTTAGTIAIRPQTSSAGGALTGSLTSLPLVTAADQVFTPAPRGNTGKAVGADASPPPRLSPGEGGGMLYPTRLEAYVVLLHTARTQALARHSGHHNLFASAEEAARQEGSLVMYASDQADPLLLRAARLLRVRHIRVLQTVAGDRALPSNPEARVHHHNYTVDVAGLQGRVVEDVACGLYPVMVVGTFGSGLSGAVDPLAALGSFCRRLSVWYHIDASHGGTALLARSHWDAAQCRLAAFADEFDGAAAMADSVLCPAGNTALPYPVLPDADCGAALLFVAQVRKVAWSVQLLGASRQSTYNQFLTPSVSDSDVLRVSPLAHSCGQLAHSAAAMVCRAGGSSALRRRSSRTSPSSATSALSDTAHRARLVALHQAFAAAVQEGVRRDGRFDTALDASLFGLVHLRWLTAADEATHELAMALSAAVAVDDAAPSDSGPVRVYVGLVQMQRRVWVTLTFGPLPEGVTEAEESAAWSGAVDSVLHRLRLAAGRVRLAA